MEENFVCVQEASILPYASNLNKGAVLQAMKKKKLLFMIYYHYQVKVPNADTIVAVATSPGWNASIRQKKDLASATQPALSRRI